MEASPINLGRPEVEESVQVDHLMLRESPRSTLREVFHQKNHQNFLKGQAARYSTQLIEGNLGRKTPEKNTKKNFDPSPPSYFRENILAQIFAKLAIGSQNDYHRKVTRTDILVSDLKPELSCVKKRAA